VENLVVDADRMRANLESTGGLIYTSSVLLELVEGGASREDAYALVQGAAMETWSGGAPFRETLRARAAPGGGGPRRGPGWTRSAGPRATCATSARCSTGSRP
jgi:hypothetical protein